MKTIGLLGGMSWESTTEYYRILNEIVRERLGGLHSARCLLNSVDFAEIETLFHAGRWDETGQKLAEAAQQLERGGADFLLLCSNTMHKLFPQVQAAVRIPLIHIADPTADRVIQQGFTRVGLLGTRITMEETFYRGRLSTQYGLDILIPPAEDRQLIDQVIFDELVRGIIRPESRSAYRRVLQSLATEGAQAVILGCTEIVLLVQPEDSPIPLFDTTRIHAEEAVARALLPDGTAPVMSRFSNLTRASALLAFFFAVDKAVAFIRQVIIARQFGLSVELDAFNVANNVPDLLYALISGGALAMAFIPILSATLTTDGRRATWDLFSRIANLVFTVTAVMSIIVAILAGPLVHSEIGIAPGFGLQQQSVVINLMRLNLIATLIFSISGLVMSGLQANQHFLMPALAPILYNVGQIFGALILSPENGYTIAGITLPAFGLGIYGLVYGVIIGAGLHLGIQIPALVHYKFHWIPSFGLKTGPVRQVLSMLGPRIVTVFFIQLIFLIS